MKRIIALALVFVFALSLMVCGATSTVAAEQRAVTTAPSARANYYTTGDLNDDDAINNRDLAFLQQYINKWDVTVNEFAADVNGDGAINNRDLALLQQYINKWDVELAPSNPEPEIPDVPITPSGAELLSQVPDELDGTEITMMLWWTPSADDTAEAKTFTDQTGIQIRYETASLDKYQANLAGKIACGNPPALAAIINEWYPQPITRGLMQPIENTGWDYTDPIYATNLMDQFSYKGEQYGIALKGSTMATFEVMFFNKEMMAEDVAAGTDPYSLWKKGQWNWATCLDLAKKYTNRPNQQYGLTLIMQYYWMLSAGQDFVLSDANELKNNINSSKLLDSWYHAWDMINTHKVIPTLFTNQQKLFANSQVAMFGGGSYFMQSGEDRPNYIPQLCDFDWGVVPFPSPKGQAAVSACEGVVWGFPTKVKGNQMQAGMWYLRYFLDDYNCGDLDFYPKDECWEVLNWMWNQQIQSYNSVGVVTYGGEINPYSLQYTLIDEATTKAQVKTNLLAWEDELDSQITQIMNDFA